MDPSMRPMEEPDLSARSFPLPILAPGKLYLLDKLEKPVAKKPMESTKPGLIQ